MEQDLPATHPFSLTHGSQALFTVQFVFEFAVALQARDAAHAARSGPLRHADGEIVDTTPLSVLRYSRGEVSKNWKTLRVWGEERSMLDIYSRKRAAARERSEPTTLYRK